MMHRWRMERAIADLLEGDLPEPRRTRLLRHLDECAACAETLEMLRETDRLLSETCPVAVIVPPDPDRATFRGAVAASGILRRRSPWLPGWGIALTTVVLGAVVVGNGVGRRVNRPESAPVTQTVLRLPQPAPRGEAPETVRQTPGISVTPVVSRAGERRRMRMRRAPRRFYRRAVSRPFRLARRPAAPVTPAAVKPAPLLVVKLTSGQPAPLLEISSREAPPETPGYARAGAWRPGTDGSLIWTQSTVATDRPGPELVLLPNLSCE
jgi:anti-sigma factor RsiW